MTIELRPASTEEDAAAACALIADYDEHFLDEPEPISTQDMLDWWVGTDEVRLAYVDGRPVGAGSGRLRGDHYEGDCFVHPDAWGRGVGTRLVEWVEELARERGIATVRLTTHAGDDRGACLFRSRGYERIRSFFRMLVDLDEEPPPVQFPEGIVVTALEPGEEPVLHEIAEASFADHWGFTPRPFDEWMRGRRIQHETCFVARSGDEVVALCACRTKFLGMGWVDTLGTRPSYRRRGLGEALLRHGFRELYLRGPRRIGLGVDAQSPTGATRLYERAGMRVAWRADVYEKRL